MLLWNRNSVSQRTILESQITKYDSATHFYPRNLHICFSILFILLWWWWWWCISGNTYHTTTSSSKMINSIYVAHATLYVHIMLCTLYHTYRHPILPRPQIVEWNRRKKVNWKIYELTERQPFIHIVDHQAIIIKPIHRIYTYRKKDT